MATWYAQASATSFFSVSGGTTSNQWNAAANGSGAWLDLSTNYTADTFNSNGKTTIGLDADVTAALLTSSGGAGTWLINTNGVTITANLVAGTVGAFLMNSGTPSVAIVGDVTGGGGSGDYCIDVSVAGTLTVTGNVTGGAGSTAHGINVSAGATLVINGNVLGGGTSLTYGIYNVTTVWASATITGNVTADDGCGIASGVAGTTVTVAGNIVDTATVSAMYRCSIIFDPGPTNYYRIRTVGASTVDLSTGGGVTGRCLQLGFGVC